MDEEEEEAFRFRVEVEVVFRIRSISVFFAKVVKNLGICAKLAQ